MHKESLWLEGLEAYQALSKHYAPEMDRAAAELRLPEWHG